MASDSVWTKTHEALDRFFTILTCKKCNNLLHDPKHFLNCGHFTCAKCIGTNTNCQQCGIPGKATDIHTDFELKELLINLSTISKSVGFTKSFSSDICKSEISPDIDNCSLASRKVFNKRSTNTKLPKENKISSDVCKSEISPNIDNRSLASSKVFNRKSINAKLPRGTKKILQLQKDINETLNSSVCESTFSSKTSSKGKANESIPKNINKKNRKGETALHIACRMNNIERIEILLKAGANPNTKDNAGWTPLQEAANYGFEKVCQLLLNAGASPDTPAYENKTALHEAVIFDNYDLASLLIKFNSNRQVFDNYGKKPIDYCKSHKMANLLKTLQNTVENKFEMDSESSKIQDLDKSINQTIDGNKILLYGSNLKPKKRKVLAYLGSEKKVKISNIFCSSVSHVILDTDATGNIRLSYDVLLAVIYGKWLLNSNCLSILSESDHIEANDLAMFELNPPQLIGGPIRARENAEKENPGLFKNCNFYFAIKITDTIKYDDITISRQQMAKLISAGDGVVLTREPRPEDIQGSLSPFHAAHDSQHSLHKCTHYIIYIPENLNSLTQKITYNMPFLKSLPLMWLIESILRFKLIDPADMGILP